MKRKLRAVFYSESPCGIVDYIIMVAFVAATVGTLAPSVADSIKLVLRSSLDNVTIRIRCAVLMGACVGLMIYRIGKQK